MKDINILIRDLPTETDNLLNSLAVINGKKKWEIVREAMIEYAEKHRGEIARAARPAKTNHKHE